MVQPASAIVPAALERTAKVIVVASGSQLGAVNTHKVGRRQVVALTLACPSMGRGVMKHIRLAGRRGTVALFIQ